MIRNTIRFLVGLLIVVGTMMACVLTVYAGDKTMRFMFTERGYEIAIWVLRFSVFAPLIIAGCVFLGKEIYEVGGMFVKAQKAGKQ